MDIKNVCDDVINLVDIPEQFSVLMDIDTPTVRLYISPFRQVIMNLVTNAVKHHDRANGSVMISAQWEPGKVHCVVTDDGPGIPEESRERVFGMFQTLRSRDDCEGSGMGLSFVQKLVETNGGSVRIEPGQKWDTGVSVCFTWLVSDSEGEQQRQEGAIQDAVA